MFLLLKRNALLLKYSSNTVVPQDIEMHSFSILNELRKCKFYLSFLYWSFFNKVSPCMSAVQKITNPKCMAVFSELFAVHICCYNMNLITVVRYLECTNSAKYFL